MRSMLAVIIARSRCIRALLRSAYRWDMLMDSCILVRATSFQVGGTVIEIHPKEIKGSWDQGYVLDVHTISSTMMLLDDLFQSGATMNVAARTLKGQGLVKSVYALALTRTRN